MKRRVLLIEDEDDIREIASLSLREVGGWEALSARSGREGIQIAKESLPDVILLDVMMPDIDGVTTLGSLRGDVSTAKIPVIFMTAKVQGADKKRLTAMQVSGLIAKPFDPLKLPQEIAKILGWAE